MYKGVTVKFEIYLFNLLMKNMMLLLLNLLLLSHSELLPKVD